MPARADPPGPAPESGRGRAPRRRLRAADQALVESYDPSAYPRPSVTVDVCVLTILDPDAGAEGGSGAGSGAGAPGGPAGEAGTLAVLVVRRDEPPFEGELALPGGFVGLDEPLEEAARRVLADKAGIEDLYLEQLYTFGDPHRDPRMRVISVAYFALAPRERLRLRPGVDPARHGWARVLPLDPESPDAGDRLADHDGRPVRLAFDHEDIVRTAARRIRGKLTYTTIAFQLVPAAFTLTELQRTYEAILRRRLSKPAFRRKVLDAGVIEETGELRRGGHRPAMLYRFVRDDPGGEGTPPAARAALGWGGPMTRPPSPRGRRA